MTPRTVWKLVLAVAGVGFAALGLSLYHESQHADYAWRPVLRARTYKTRGPRVVIDEAHENASKGSFPERYWPFARLLRADGYRVRAGHARFTDSSLAGVDVLVIANASGAPHPQLLGINLPVRTTRKRGDPAFALDEIDAVARWVERGGSLLLIADHAPFGAASESLAAAFHVAFGKGFVEVPHEPSDPLVFSRENGRLGEHAILTATGNGGLVARVETFTGQSLDGPPEATELLRLPANAVEYVPNDTGMVEHPARRAQGLAMTWGRGRAVILGEAAMLTAQVSQGKPFGFNLPGNDNRAFALGVMHWLSHAE
jgi:hypothetical protein